MNFKKRCIEVALTSAGVGERNNYRHGAVLFTKKHLYSAKTNTGKTHAILSKFTTFPFLHAETACIVSHGFDNCHGLDLAVTRVLRDGSRTMSRPCAVCRSVIRKVGIRRVYYTDWEGNWRCDK